MPTRLKTLAIAVALAAGTSTAAMAQYTCPAGYTYVGGVCQPIAAPVPAPAPAYPAYPAYQAPTGPVSGAAAGGQAGAASGAAAAGPVGAIVGGALGRRRVRLPAPPTRSPGARAQLRLSQQAPAGRATIFITAPAIRSPEPVSAECSEAHVSDVAVGFAFRSTQTTSARVSRVRGQR